MKSKKAMIFAAGLGSRLRPLTNDCPKAMVKVAEKPLLEWVILKLRATGYECLIVNVHHFADQIIDFLEKKENFGIDIHISDERDFLLETGGGIKYAADLLRGDEPILIHNVDIISDLDLAALRTHHLQSGNLATLAVSGRKTSRYLLFDKNQHLTAWKNVKTDELRQARIAEGTETPFAFSGIHMIESKMLDLISETGKFSIIGVYLRLAADYPIGAFTHDYLHWIDVGRPENLAKAESHVKQYLSGLRPE